MTRPDIAVVGGGLLGRCLAWRASRAGARVVSSKSRLVAAADTKA
jgi:glycine/D-amino acid oxidase-like deaminating enzyme